MISLSSIFANLSGVRGPLSAVIPLVALLIFPLPGFASVIQNDPQGFQGIPWGTAIADRPDFVLIDSGERIKAYTLKQRPLDFGGITVDSMKFMTIDDHLARVTIRYRGEHTHKMILDYLEAEFGRVDLMPGSMMRGLNQQYTWRGDETEINMTYRGLGELGFLTVDSRVLAPVFLNQFSDHSF